LDIFDWIDRNLSPRPGTSGELLYNDMASQSGRSLPIIYQPFAPECRGHWRDRGAALDFVLATQGAGKRILDVGPGDGWPSLIIAPWAGEVVGVEGSRRRAEVCRANAQRLGIHNATFRYVQPGAPLPFDAASFDAVVAASSLEQTPDPQAMMAECFRVLRPGGRLRMTYEALNRYRGDREHGLWLLTLLDQRTRLILYHRHLAKETVDQVGITFDIDRQTLIQTLTHGRGELNVDDVTPARLQPLCAEGKILDVRTLTTRHPSGTTWATWMAQIGFSHILPTHDGIRMAGELFDHLPPDCRPTTLEAIDVYLRPILEVVIDMPAPLAYDPMITAVK
jgi:SAM-dependent methyltransferase